MADRGAATASVSAPPASRLVGVRSSQLYVVAAVVLGVGAGIVIPDPATWLTIIAGALAAAGFFLSTRREKALSERFLTRFLAIGVLGTVLIGLITPPLLDAWYRPLLLVTGIAALGAMFWPTVRAPLVVFVIASQFCVAVWLVASLRPASQDVHMFVQEASQALLDGENPYELRYRNIYGEGTDRYAPEHQEGDLLNFGFPYPPLTLVIGIPGYVIGGDYRYAAAAAVAATALLLAFTRRGPVGPGIAAIFLLSPLTLRVLHNGWTEPFVGILLAGVVFSTTRWPRATPVVLGLLIAAKQYLVPVLAIALVTMAEVRRSAGSVRMALVPLAIALASVLPFLIWNPGEFIHSIVLLQIDLPFRADSISIPGLVARRDLFIVPTWVGFLAGAAALVAVWRWAPRTPAGFAGATAVVFFSFFLLSKQAFMNYYFFVFVALSCAVAAVTSEEGSGPDGSRPI